MPSSERSQPPPWPTCPEADCQGRQLSGGGQCIAHASKDDRAKALRTLAAGTPLDFPAGVRFTEDLLAELLAALPRDDDEHRVLHQADFRGATLPSADFQQASFQGDAMFDEVTFQGDALFVGASFQDVAKFGLVSFRGGVSFDMADFQGNALFNGTSFQDVALFRGADFQGGALFVGANFQGHARFGWECQR